MLSLSLEKLVTCGVIRSYNLICWNCKGCIGKSIGPGSPVQYRFTIPSLLAQCHVAGSMPRCWLSASGPMDFPMQPLQFQQIKLLINPGTIWDKIEDWQSIHVCIYSIIMVNLKQHQFSWGRRVPLSWREIGKSNLRLLCWEFHHGHLTDPSFFTQIFLAVVKMAWHLVMGREDDGCWNPNWGYRMIQVERIKNSSNLVKTESFSLEYYEIRTRQDVHMSCFNVVRSFAFSTKSNPTWNVWSFLLQNWLQTHRITCICTSAPNLAVGVWHWGIQEWSALRRETRWQNVTSRTWSRCVALQRACTQGRKARRSEAKAATLSWE